MMHIILDEIFYFHISHAHVFIYFISCISLVIWKLSELVKSYNNPVCGLKIITYFLVQVRTMKYDLITHAMCIASRI